MKRVTVFLLAMWLLSVAVLVAPLIADRSFWWPRVFLWIALICVLAIAVTFAFGKKRPQLVDRVIVVPAFAYLLISPFLATLILIIDGNEHVSLVVYREGVAAFLILPLAMLIAAPALLKTRSFTFRMGALFMAVSFVGLGELVFGKGFFGDILAPRQHVVGTVIEMEPGYYQFGQGWEAASVNISGKWYSVAHDLEPLFHVGAVVDAEAGAGSKFLLKVSLVVP